MRKYIPLTAFALLTIMLISLSGCWSFYKDDYNGSYTKEEAYVPMYGLDTTYKKIYVMPAQPIVQSGKIYVLGVNLFQIEKYRGVHVINYSDKTKPVKLGFIKIGGAVELAVKGNFLIVNNHEDLVTIDISDLNNIREVSRIPGAFKTWYEHSYLSQELARPAAKGKYYVCPSPQTGYQVVGWKLEKNVSGANCYNR